LSANELKIQVFGTTIGSINGLQRSGALLRAHIYHKIKGTNTAVFNPCNQTVKTRCKGKATTCRPTSPQHFLLLILKTPMIFWW
jgi:hypothetical protein